MLNPKVSISVPVYNVEKFLRKSLDSLVNQTLQEIEIIIVNDGSTDSCSTICDEYAAKDPRIVIINKANGGLASARQAALDVARGEYFCACDADDWVEHDMYEKLYQKAQETDADIVMCDYWSEYHDEKRVASHYEFDLSKREDMLDDALNKHFPTMVWNKLYKRTLFKKYNLSWEQGINMGEDLLIMLKILSFPVRVAHIPVPLYHYRRIIGGSSYTNSISLSAFNQLLRIRKWTDENIYKEKYRNGLFVQWLDQAFAGLRVKEGMTSQYYQYTTLTRIPYIGFVKYSYSKLKGLVVLISKIFGYRAGRILVKLLYRYIYQ